MRPSAPPALSPWARGPRGQARGAPPTGAEAVASPGHLYTSLSQGAVSGGQVREAAAAPSREDGVCAEEVSVLPLGCVRSNFQLQLQSGVG